jgi:hypothetical protein
MLFQMNFIEVMLNSFRTFFGQVGAFLPRLIGALLILAIGWIIARLVRAAVSKGLTAIRFDDIAQRSGIDALLKQGDVPLTLNAVLAGLIYWFFMLITMLAAVDSLGLAVASDLFNRIVLYLPNVFVAVVILIIGGLLAKLIRGTVSTVLANTQVEGARAISSLAYYAIIVFAVSVALVQLQIGRDLVLAAFRLAFGGLCLALAIAFGLGGKDWATRTIDRNFKQ